MQELHQMIMKEEERLQEKRGRKEAVKRTKAKVRSWNRLQRHWQEAARARQNSDFFLSRLHMRPKSEPLRCCDE